MLPGPAGCIFFLNQDSFLPQSSPSWPLLDRLPEAYAGRRLRHLRGPASAKSPAQQSQPRPGMKWGQGPPPALPVPSTAPLSPSGGCSCPGWFCFPVPRCPRLSNGATSPCLTIFSKATKTTGIKYNVCHIVRGALSTYVPGTEGGFSLPR